MLIVRNAKGFEFDIANQLIMTNRIYSGANNLPAYNYVYFAMYYNMFQNTLVHSYNKEMEVFGLVYSTLMSGNIEKAKTICINASVGIENAIKHIPFEYKALDCITLNIDYSHLEDESESFSFSKGISLTEARASIRSFYKSLDHQLDGRFCNDNFYKAELLEKKTNFLNNISTIVNLPVIDNVFDIYNEALERNELDSMAKFEPLQLLGLGTMQDYKDKYLKEINQFALNLGFDSLSDLQKITVFDYFSRISIETNKAMAHNRS